MLKEEKEGLRNLFEDGPRPLVGVESRPAFQEGNFAILKTFNIKNIKNLSNVHTF